MRFFLESNADFDGYRTTKSPRGHGQVVATTRGERELVLNAKKCIKRPSISIRHTDVARRPGVGMQLAIALEH